MSVRFVGPYQTMGPVDVDSSATIARGDFVTVSSGTVSEISLGSNTNLAVALDGYPDTEYEGTKTQVDLALRLRFRSLPLTLLALSRPISVGALTALRPMVMSILTAPVTVCSLFVVLAVKPHWVTRADLSLAS